MQSTNILFALSLLLCTLISTTHAKDRVRPVVGGMISGTIERVTADSVRITGSSGSQEFAIDEVSSIEFDGEPTALKRIRSAVVAGQLEKASDQLKTIKPGNSKYAKQEIDFYKAYVTSQLALQGSGSVTNAARQMGAFLKANPTSHRYYDGCEAMGNLAKSLGKVKSAATYYSKIASSSSPNLAAHGNLLLGDALLSQGDTAKASTFYKRMATAEDDRLQSLGTIGMAACQAQSGQGADAIEDIERVIKTNDSKDIELFARAYNALGLAFAATGNSEAALDAFLHTDLLFHRDKERHAEALYNLASLWSTANKPAEASKARRTLKERYTSSLWAKK